LLIARLLHAYSFENFRQSGDAAWTNLNIQGGAIADEIIQLVSPTFIRHSSDRRFDPTAKGIADVLQSCLAALAPAINGNGHAPLELFHHGFIPIDHLGAPKLVCWQNPTELNLVGKPSR